MLLWSDQRELPPPMMAAKIYLETYVNDGISEGLNNLRWSSEKQGFSCIISETVIHLDLEEPIKHSQISYV